MGRYIGVRSPVDGVLIKSIEHLDSMLMEDNLFAAVQYVYWIWDDENNHFPEYCVSALYATEKEIIQRQDSKRLTDRVFARRWKRAVGPRM